jgi:hypothetical protein
MTDGPGYQTRYIVQPYLRGARGRLGGGQPEMFETEERARRRAAAAFAAGAIGVQVVRQSGVAELGEYDEPMILMSLGEVPASD